MGRLDIHGVQKRHARGNGGGDRYGCPYCGTRRGVGIFKHKDTGKVIANCFACDAKSGDIMRALGHTPEAATARATDGTTDNGEYLQKIWRDSKPIYDADSGERTALTSYLVSRLATKGNAAKSLILLNHAGCRLVTETLKGERHPTLLAPIRHEGNRIGSAQRIFLSAYPPSGLRRKTRGQMSSGYLDLLPPACNGEATVICEGVEKALAICLAGFGARVSFGASRFPKVASTLRASRAVIFCDNDKPVKGSRNGVSVDYAVRICRSRSGWQYVLPPSEIDGREVKDADAWLLATKGDPRPMRHAIRSAMR